ncbi:superoxide dismutase [Fredinandcohnia sp. 179-A 10B2 NHS]|uniref:superoxide dismutase n=1 Tax=Fredinandcohnia sp. 179-A 10B2 NHS TaxID=3235176 RepID=UPI00399F2F3C
MSHLDKYRQYVDEVTSWFEEFKEEITITRSEKLLSRIEEFEKTLETVRNNITFDSIRNLTNDMEALYKESTQIASESDLGKEIVDMRRVDIGQHKLPPLPYRYDALEPHISSEIMRLHHDKHHKSYVDGLNKAERMMQQARETGNYDLLKHWEREAAFHGSGHYLHTIFWNVMTPQGGGMPGRNLLRQINNDFGSFERFKKHFTEAANKVEGVGWAILVWAPRSGRLEILQAEKHQNLTQWDTIPLLVLDVWEHAYYLQYKNVREDYVNNWWNVVNWKEVEQRFQHASRLQWKQF